ncbi:hypothetical protein RHMOL_Rhmol08G0208500 [Rhododendron molle]|uniref:Uncharacterized protein n=1 Tax=Rhododendron molle TaxID=49168 RepID=A0ACC0MR05_RHOML|nr:hypothetical protein RHMOL_Rhmol08G0208500 [Rhododendron molle]
MLQEQTDREREDLGREFWGAIQFRCAAACRQVTVAAENLTGTAHRCRLQKTESQVREQGLLGTGGCICGEREREQ